MRLILCATLLTLAGCASTANLRETAPDWYEARKTELAGEGYPSLSRVPRDSTYQQTSAELVTSGATGDTRLARFLSDPRSDPAYLTPGEITHWGDVLRQDMNGLNVAADFLTDAEISALRAKFSRPRARP